MIQSYGLPLVVLDSCCHALPLPRLSLPLLEDLALLVKLEAHHIYVVGKMLKQLFNFKVNLKLGHKWLWLVLLESRSVACLTLILFDCSWQIRPETTSKPTASLFWGGCQLCYIALEICSKSTLFLCRNSEAGQRRHVRWTTAGQSAI